MSDKEYQNKPMYQQVVDWLYTLDYWIDVIKVDNENLLKEWKNGLSDESYLRFMEEIEECIDSIDNLHSIMNGITKNLNKQNNETSKNSN